MSVHSDVAQGAGPSRTLYGFIIQRDAYKSEFLIESKSGDRYTFDGRNCDRGARFLQFVTVKFASSDTFGSFGGVPLPIATNVSEVDSALPLDCSPDIKAYVLKFNGSEGLLSFDYYNTKLTLRFFDRNLLDKNRPSVGSHVLINTKMFISKKYGQDDRRLTQTYRIRADTKMLSESRAFVCPTFAVKRLTQLTSSSTIIYVGEFEKEFEVFHRTPFSPLKIFWCVCRATRGLVTFPSINCLIICLTNTILPCLLRQR